MKFEFYADVKDGKLSGYSRCNFEKELWKFESKRVEVRIQNKSARTVQQNRLWWAYVTILSNDLGYSKDEVHEILKFKFLQKEKVDEKTGETFPYLGSTAKLSKIEFGELVDKLQQWAVEQFNIILPSPDEQMKLI